MACRLLHLDSNVYWWSLSRLSDPSDSIADNYGTFHFRDMVMASHDPLVTRLHHDLCSIFIDSFDNVDVMGKG